MNIEVVQGKWYYGRYPYGKREPKGYYDLDAWVLGTVYFSYERVHVSPSGNPPFILVGAEAIDEAFCELQNRYDVGPKALRAMKRKMAAEMKRASKKLLKQAA